MMKKLYFAIAGLVFAIVNAQHVGVGTINFDDSEVFKVASNNKGVLLPNVSIPNLNAASPVTSPAESLLVYNTDVTTGKGFYFWKDNKWNPLVDSSNIFKLLGITRSESEISTSVYTFSSYYGAVAYTLGRAPIDPSVNHNFYSIPGLVKTFTISSATNNLTVFSSGTLQVNSTSSQSVYITYSIGVFVDDKLASVRNFIINGSSACLSNDFNIFYTARNLSVGQHKVEIYATTRVNEGPNMQISFGGKNPGCTNSGTINNDMAKSILNIQITDK